jgi:large subunit ribosomal protein L10
MHPDKATIVEDLQKKLNATPFLFVADYTGLTVDKFGELRTRLAGVGARCHVVKNSFLKRAAKEAGYPELGELAGQNAIVVGDKDVAAAAKVLKSFTAEFQKPAVKTGVVDRMSSRASRSKRLPICRRAKSFSRRCSGCCRPRRHDWCAS